MSFAFVHAKSIYSHPRAQTLHPKAPTTLHTLQTYTPCNPTTPQPHTLHTCAIYPKTTLLFGAVALRQFYNIVRWDSISGLLWGSIVCGGPFEEGKSPVSFAEYRLFDRALLQKRPIILRSILIVARVLNSPDKSQCCVVATISRHLTIVSLFCKRAL